jgi:hypothetical protein
MSQHQWGRSKDAGRTPSHLPIYTLLLLPLALAAGLGAAVYRYQVGLTTLQRWYLPAYLKSSYVPRQFREAGQYQLVDVVDDHYVARQPATYRHAEIEPWLRDEHFNGLTAWAFLKDCAWWPLATAIGVLLVGLFVTIPLDRDRAQTIRDGKILRGGPRPRTVAEFNRHHRRNDGISIRVE